MKKKGKHDDENEKENENNTNTTKKKTKIDMSTNCKFTLEVHPSTRKYEDEEKEK